MESIIEIFQMSSGNDVLTYTVKVTFCLQYTSRQQFAGLQFFERMFLSAYNVFDKKI